MVRLRADSLGNMVLTSDTSSSNSEASDPSEDDYSSTASLQPESEDLEIDLPTMDEDPDPAEEADASSIDYEGQYPTESIKQSLQKCFSAAEAMKETLAVAVANPGDETVISNSAKKKLRKHMNVVQEQLELLDTDFLEIALAVEEFTEGLTEHAQNLPAGETFANIVVLIQSAASDFRSLLSMLPPTDFHPSHLVSIISPLSPPLTNLARNHPHLLEQFSTLLTRTTTLAAAYTTLSRTLMRTIAGPILHICYNAQMRYYASMRSLCCVRHRTAVLPRIKKLQKLARGLWRLLYPAPRFSETVLGEKLGVYAPQLEGMVDAGLSFNEMGALVLTVVPVGLMAGVLARGMVDRSVVAALLGVGWQVHAVYERAKVRVEVKRWVKGQRVEVPVMVPEDLAEDERNTDATTTPPQTEPNAVKKRRNRHKKNTLKPEEKDQVDDENKPPATGGNKNRRRMKNRAKA